MLLNVSEGFKEAAEKFQDEAGLPAPPQLSEMDNRISIRDAIQSGRIAEAISLVLGLPSGAARGGGGGGGRRRQGQGGQEDRRVPEDHREIP